MLELEQILKFFPPEYRKHREHVLREYLQWVILDIIYRSEYGQGLVFMGGTAIRILHGGPRFSEDLDFDNRGLSADDFKKISSVVSSGLRRQGYEIEIKNVLKGAYHCHIRFPGLLFQQGLSDHQKARILIQLDAEPQHYNYDPEPVLLNRFGLFRTIRAASLPLLLSQKIAAALSRKRAKGRDFFDIVFLAGLTSPDYKYIQERYGIGTRAGLVSLIKKRCAELDFNALASDVEPFLLDPGQAERVRMFPELSGELFRAG